MTKQQAKKDKDCRCVNETGVVNPLCCLDDCAQFVLGSVNTQDGGQAQSSFSRLAAVTLTRLTSTVRPELSLEDHRSELILGYLDLQPESDGAQDGKSQARRAETETEGHNWLCWESKQQQTVSIRSCWIITSSD